jgi:methylphosphotriester-DNA--protein-cysteine methyltransferase
MANPKSSNYFEYIIRDADSYRSMLSGTNLEIFQLEPGRLTGRHVRLGLPSGEFSYIETNLPLRGGGHFSNLWTLSLILQSKTRSLQHGIEVRAGSLIIHGPGAEHDGVYGRNSKLVCFGQRDEVLTKHIRRLPRKLQDAIRQPWSVFEPPAASRQDVIAHFAEAAAIIQSEPRVRNSRRALANFEEELVRDFLQAFAQQFPSHCVERDRRAAAMVRRVDDAVQKSRRADATVVELCADCEVPRRTLDRAFQHAVGMGPATYLRRARLNRARCALENASNRSTTVTDIAFELGFWHLGRFAEQYHELFGEPTNETRRRAGRLVRTAQA